MSKYEIIGSSSAGNSIIYCRHIMVDVGLTYNKLEPYMDNVKIILLTHIHGDHFHKKALDMIGKRHPGILLCVPEYLMNDIIELGYKGRIFRLEQNKKYRFTPTLTIETFPLFHDVPNMGYKINNDGYRIVHATDTGSIKHVEAVDYDLYAIEHNYDEEEIMKAIDAKLKAGVYSHEIRSKETHLSFQDAEDWITSQMNNYSEVVMLHISQSYLK